ncbi:hypothetical protein ABZ920_10235 [Streptomyces sp. NPDC046831]|uniref:hypothetical protein n=1 Tax=Streptomyces sp. NPDC046831 TaxID=3154805 RepID=UPI0034091717
MTGSTPPWKRRSSRGKADPEPSDGSHGARDDERGRSRPSGTSGTAGPASLASVSGRGEGAAPPPDPAPAHRTGRSAEIRDRVREAARRGARGRAGLTYVTERIIEIAPRVPVRDLATLRRQFPGLGPEQLADKLVAGASKATSTVGAGVGAAAMLPVPPAMPAELAAEIISVAAIELKLIAELHEVYGVRPPGKLKDRSTAYLSSWSGERGIDVLRPSTISTALGGGMRRRLRRQIMKRTVRDVPNLLPFMVGAAVGAIMNRRETRKLAARIRDDLRKVRVPWEALPELSPLERPADALDLGDTPAPGT